MSEDLQPQDFVSAMPGRQELLEEKIRHLEERMSHQSRWWIALLILLVLTSGGVIAWTYWQVSDGAQDIKDLRTEAASRLDQTRAQGLDALGLRAKSLDDRMNTITQMIGDVEKEQGFLKARQDSVLMTNGWVLPGGK